MLMIGAGLSSVCEVVYHCITNFSVHGTSVLDDISSPVVDSRLYFHARTGIDREVITALA